MKKISRILLAFICVVISAALFCPVLASAAAPIPGGGQQYDDETILMYNTTTTLNNPAQDNKSLNGALSSNVDFGTFYMSVPADNGSITRNGTMPPIFELRTQYNSFNFEIGNLSQSRIIVGIKFTGPNVATDNVRKLDAPGLIVSTSEVYIPMYLTYGDYFVISGGNLTPGLIIQAYGVIIYSVENTNQSAYDEGYNAGLDDGYKQGYDDGFRDGFIIGDEGGATSGAGAALQSARALIRGVWSIVDVPILGDSFTLGTLLAIVVILGIVIFILHLIRG